MSIKLYNGYCLPAWSAAKLLAWCHQLKPQFEQIRQHSLYQTLAGDLAYRLDRATVEQKPLTRILPEVLTEFRQRQRELIQSPHKRDPELDFACSAVFFPLPTKTLVLFFCDNLKLQKIWHQSGVKSYLYQNQTDRPREVSASAWKKREQEWTQVLLQHSPAIPSQLGLTFEFSQNEVYLDPSQIDQFWPSLTARVRRLAFDLLFQDYCRQQNIILANDTLWESYGDYRRWTQEKPGREALAAKEKELRPILLKKYKISDLE